MKKKRGKLGIHHDEKKNDETIKKKQPPQDGADGGVEIPRNPVPSGSIDSIDNRPPYYSIDGVKTGNEERSSFAGRPLAGGSFHGNGGRLPDPVRRR